MTGKSPSLPTQTRGDVRTLINRARTAAAILKTPGHRFSGTGERAALALVLEALATVAHRRLDPHHEPEPDVYHGPDDVVTDLFGEAA